MTCTRRARILWSPGALDARQLLFVSVVGPAAVVDPASLDTLDDEDVLSAIAVIISRSVFWGAL